MYEKGRASPRLLPIRGVAQGSQLYRDIEDYLTQEIEGPANDVLKKIRNREAISDSEKLTLSKYILVFYKRVLAGFNRFKEKGPEAAKTVAGRWDEHLSKLEAEDPAKAEQYEKLRKRVLRICNDLGQNPSKEMWASSFPHGTDKVPDMISKMTWTFYYCTYPDIYITCDNPVFIHHAIGIGKPHSDLSFPLAKEISLLATWRKGNDLRYRAATPQQIKELNRRTAFNMTRFAYGPVNRTWIADLLNKPEHEVHLWVQQFPGGQR
jgi:hypothetical protein